MLDSLGLFGVCPGRGERIRTSGLYVPTVLTQTAEEGGATRVLKLRQIEPEFLERMFSVEDI